MIPPRPTDSDPVIVRAAVEQLYPKVADWLASQDPGFRENEAQEKQEIIEQITEAIDDACGNNDGYNLASKLEFWYWYCWRPNSDLVEILDSTAHYLSEATTVAVKAWVITHNVTAPLAVGTRVNAEWSRQVHTGTIVRIRAETSQYVIQEDGKSYPKSRPIKLADGTIDEFFCGTIIDYEKVTAAPVTITV